MQFAVLGDVCGSVNLLAAALDAVAEEGLQCVVCTGNLAVGDAFDPEVFGALRGAAVRCVQGATDRALIRFGRKGGADAALAHVHARVASADIEWLRALPKRQDLTLDGVSVLVCYGSPSNPAELLEADSVLARFRRQREAFPSDIVVCGGAAAPFARWVDGTLFVSPGPLDAGGNRARWTRVDTSATPWSAEVCLVPCG